MSAIYITDQYPAYREFEVEAESVSSPAAAKNREIESDAVWRRGDDSTEGVEIAFLASGNIGLRDSRNPDGPVLVFTPGEWRAFVAGAKDGEFNRPGK